MVLLLVAFYREIYLEFNENSLIRLIIKATKKLSTFDPLIP